MSKTLLDVTVLCVGTGYTANDFNADIYKCVLNYEKNPNNSSETYCFLKGSVDVELDGGAIPCDEVTLVDATMRCTHASANDIKAPFHVAVSFLKTYGLKGSPLKNSFLLEAGLNNDQTRSLASPIKFVTNSIGVPKKWSIDIQQLQHVGDLGSQQLSGNDCIVLNLKFEVNVERI